MQKLRNNILNISLGFILVWLLGVNSVAQNVAITDDTGYSADPSAMLDVKSIDKGMLVPRLTTAQRTTISSPATGLLVFDSDLGDFYFYTGSAWINLSSANASGIWNKTGLNVHTSDTAYKVGVGTSAPFGKLEVKGDSGMAGDDPLFEVINSSGDTVFAVFSQGVRINVADDPTVKSTSSKGGFAVGGFSLGKGSTNEYMRVTPDSVRIYIEEPPSVKGTASKGGFAVGGFSLAKTDPVDYFNISGASNTDTINPSEPRIFWYPVKEALLAGRVLIESADSVGTNSFSSGFESKAIGNYSQALGYSARAFGNNSTAIGNYADARSFSSFAFGDSAISSGAGAYAIGSVGRDDAGVATGIPTKATGNYSFAIGHGSVASGPGAFALGTSNTAGSYLSLAIGQGSQAMGDASIAIGWDAQAWDSQSFALGNNSISTGPLSFSFGLGASNAGYKSMSIGIGSNATSNAYESVAIGTGASVSEAWAFSAGYYSSAEAENATAIGYMSTANGVRSVALGWCTASGTASLALGRSNASGNSSVSIGGGVGTASGDYSFVGGGFLNTAHDYYETVFGRYSVTGTGSQTTWVNGDHLFVVGNGATSSSRNNALTLYKNGDLVIDGDFTTNNGLLFHDTENGNAIVELKASDDVYPDEGITLRTLTNPPNGEPIFRVISSGGSERLRVEHNGVLKTSNGIEVDGVSTSYIMGNVAIRQSSANVALDVFGSIEYTGTIMDVSDKRVKENIQPIDNAMSRIMLINGVSYNLIGEESKELGVIAQEVQKVCPEAVSIVDEENGYLGVSYVELVPVLIEALKEVKEDSDKSFKKYEQEISLLRAEIEHIRLSQKQEKTK